MCFLLQPNSGRGRKKDVIFFAVFFFGGGGGVGGGAKLLGSVGFFVYFLFKTFPLTLPEH